MIAPLPLSPTPGQAHEWLVRVVQAVGPGFHPDTPAAEYFGDSGPTFNRDQARIIDNSLNHVFNSLGATVVYDVALAEVQRQLQLV